MNLPVHAQPAATLTFMPEAIRETLLKASTMIYLFRALSSADTTAGKRDVELHIISLVNDVSGTDGGFVVLGQLDGRLMDEVRTRDFPGIANIAHRICAEGIV